MRKERDLHMRMVKRFGLVLMVLALLVSFAGSAMAAATPGYSAPGSSRSVDIVAYYQPREGFKLDSGTALSWDKTESVANNNLQSPVTASLDWGGVLPTDAKSFVRLTQRLEVQASGTPQAFISQDVQFYYANSGNQTDWLELKGIRVFALVSDDVSRDYTGIHGGYNGHGQGDGYKSDDLGAYVYGFTVQLPSEKTSEPRVLTFDSTVGNPTSLLDQVTWTPLNRGVNTFKIIWNNNGNSGSANTGWFNPTEFKIIYYPGERILSQFNAFVVNPNSRYYHKNADGSLPNIFTTIDEVNKTAVINFPTPAWSTTMPQPSNEPALGLSDGFSQVSNNNLNRLLSLANFWDLWDFTDPLTGTQSGKWLRPTVEFQLKDPNALMPPRTASAFFRNDFSFTVSSWYSGWSADGKAHVRASAYDTRFTDYTISFREPYTQRNLKEWVISRKDVNPPRTIVETGPNSAVATGDFINELVPGDLIPLSNDLREAHYSSIVRVERINDTQTYNVVVAAEATELGNRAVTNTTYVLSFGAAPPPESTITPASYTFQTVPGSSAPLAITGSGTTFAVNADYAPGFTTANFTPTVTPAPTLTVSDNGSVAKSYKLTINGVDYTLNFGQTLSNSTSLTQFAIAADGGNRTITAISGGFVATGNYIANLGAAAFVQSAAWNGASVTRATADSNGTTYTVYVTAANGTTAVETLGFAGSDWRGGSSGGGCDAGLGAFGLIVLAGSAMVLRRKK
ncbi:hypothetical protein FACS1894167_03820 [Synergistales bacterium]|nr:hypothetical protein FACS1894167_03820 [Synergistales bacterium]